MDYVTGSLALNQFNIISYCQRPFKTAAEMNSKLIDNINRVVKSTDHLIILGDFVFAPLDNDISVKVVRDFRNRINCNKISLIVGNQDSRMASDFTFRKLFLRVENYLEYITESQVSLILFHYRIATSWNRMNNNSYQLHAHLHGRNLEDDEDNQLDCSVDSANILLGDYRPFSVEEIVKICNKS